MFESSPAYLKGQSLKLVELFVKHGANIHIENKSCNTPKGLIESRSLSTFSMNRELANSMQQSLEEQKSSKKIPWKVTRITIAK
ncbi:hypothetical protein IHO40_04265 [Wolbachia endosymbiont of Mansonella ozzardi]|nr:hypothetical protein [Wolbachia endosymbiont of Mansonella ozzardi]